MGALASRRPARRPGLSAVFSTRTCGPILTGWTFQSSLGTEADSFPQSESRQCGVCSFRFYPGLLPSC